MKYGLKLWSINTNSLNSANELFDRGLFDFIELYVVPGTESTMEQWRAFRGKFMIHCAHSAHGFNLARPEYERINREIFYQAQLFADFLGANDIVLHGGNGGSVEETIRQLSFFEDMRILIENKPKFGMNNNVCVGWSPEEIHLIIQRSIVKGLVFDMGHAIYAANAEAIEPRAFLKQFLKLGPEIFHVGDGDKHLLHDCHKNIGAGNFDLDVMLGMIPLDSCVTLETPGNPSEGLGYFLKDITKLKDLLNHNGRK